MTDEGVCAADAGPRPDVVVPRDVVAAPDVVDVAVFDAGDPDDASVSEDLGEEPDGEAPTDDVEPFKDAEFEDLGPDEDADPAFDREDPTTTGCDCRVGARATPRGGLALLALALAGALRRRRRAP